MVGFPDGAIAYFGYGSLVNLATLRTPYLGSVPATLTGWERIWLSRPKVEGSFAPVNGLAFLSVRPNSNKQIDGLVVADRAESLSSLDTREALYHRLQIERKDIEIEKADEYQSDIPLFMYVANTTITADPNARILRSYLDAVLQGYFQHFGEAGLARFVETTVNFDLEIYEDRKEPIYPRPVETSKTERKLFDALVPVKR